MSMNKAPQFSLTDQNGDQHSLSDYTGRWVVLYFYPKDDTPGCTTEACSFRDEREAIMQYGNAAVIGVSADSVSSHKKFADKHNLSFTLLSDPDHTVIKAYGAWAPKRIFGRELLGIVRKTVIINPNGIIVKQYPAVSPKDHAKQIIDDLALLQS